MHWALLPFRRYFDFKGRSRRMEFWSFQLMYWLVLVGFFAIILAALPWSAETSIDIDTSGQEQAAQAFSDIPALFWVGIALMGIWYLAVLIPGLAVTVRRLHDRDMSGWWYGGLILLGFVPILNFFVLFGYLALLVVLFLDGTRGPNRYGPDPKDPHQANVFE